MQMLLEVSAFGLTAIMAGWLGVIPLAAHQIAMGLASISFMIVVGIGSATTIRVAHQYGRNDLRGLMMASKASIHLVLSIMAIAAIGFILFRNQIPKLYTQDASVIEISAMLLIIVAIFQLFDGLQVIMLGILRGLGDVNHAMIYAFFAYIVINLPLGYYLGFVLGMGITGLWIAFLVGLGCAAFLFAWRFRHLYSIIKSKTI
jgi:MATE family multidrug resistance protein